MKKLITICIEKNEEEIAVKTANNSTITNLRASLFGIIGLCLLTAAAAFLSLTVQAKANVITNGGFESGAFSPSWSTVGNAATPYVGVRTSAVNIIAEEGNYFATFSNFAYQDMAGISQNVSTTPGQTYVLSCWFTNSTNSDQLNVFKITWNGDALLDLVNFEQLPSWTNYTFQVTGTGDDVVTFTGYQNIGWNGLDNVSLTPIPEPATLCLLGLGGLALLRKRRA
jgi:hypothetical protein